MSKHVIALHGKMDRERACDECGATMVKPGKLSRAQWQARRFCSQECSGKAKTKALAAMRAPLRDAFFSRFAGGLGCWEWRGTLDGYGYGVIDHAGKRYRAHVLSVEFSGRPVPDGSVVRHTCDNPRCVRPDHLLVGAAAENVADCISRDRFPRGSRSGQAKLTDASVKEMRAARLQGETFDAIAKRFGVSRPTAARAISAKSWGHVR